VVTAAGLDDVVLYGQVMSGPVAALYAATHPECTRALILFNSYAATPRSDDYEAGRTPAEYEPLIAWVEQVCGSGHCLRASMPSVQVDDAQLRVLARIERFRRPRRARTQGHTGGMETLRGHYVKPRESAIKRQAEPGHRYRLLSRSVLVLPRALTAQNNVSGSLPYHRL
jgi:pimeloyl-ACP methyl ester carboxylesterase